MDAIIVPRLLSELHREFGRTRNVAYIDIKAAFDSVDRNALGKALRCNGVPPFLLRLTEYLHNETSSRIRHICLLFDSFLATYSVRQGFILASALFCRAIDWILSRCADDLGINVGNEKFTDFHYRDDAVLFKEDRKSVV